MECPGEYRSRRRVVAKHLRLYHHGEGVVVALARPVPLIGGEGVPQREDILIEVHAPAEARAPDGRGAVDGHIVVLVVDGRDLVLRRAGGVGRGRDIEEQGREERGNRAHIVHNASRAHLLDHDAVSAAGVMHRDFDLLARLDGEVGEFIRPAPRRVQVGGRAAGGHFHAHGYVADRNRPRVGEEGRRGGRPVAGQDQRAVLLDAELEAAVDSRVDVGRLDVVLRVLHIGREEQATRLYARAYRPVEGDGEIARPAFAVGPREVVGVELPGGRLASAPHRAGNRATRPGELFLLRVGGVVGHEVHIEHIDDFLDGGVEGAEAAPSRELAAVHPAQGVGLDVAVGGKDDAVHAVVAEDKTEAFKGLIEGRLPSVPGEGTRGDGVVKDATAVGIDEEMARRVGQGHRTLTGGECALHDVEDGHAPGEAELPVAECAQHIAGGDGHTTPVDEILAPRIRGDEARPDDGSRAAVREDGEFDLVLGRIVGVELLPFTAFLPRGIHAGRPVGLGSTFVPAVGQRPRKRRF